MAVIIPCAGLSSRFPGTRPKYLLTLSDGECLFEKAADKYIQCGLDVHFAILREHVDKYDAKIAIDKVYDDYDNVTQHIFEEQTSGPAETVYRIAQKLGNEPIFIQDCDSFFEGEFRKDNHVNVIDLRKNLSLQNIAAKSFAAINEQSVVTNIVEKSVISNFICVGGYGFRSAAEYCKAFEYLSNTGNIDEIFVSHVIKKMIEDGVFVANEVEEYVDLGTYKEFVEYNKQRATIFCDLDGTVFYNQSKLFSNDYSNTPQVIPNAVKYLLKKQSEGATLIFTTSRPEKYYRQTEEALRAAGIDDFRILYDVPHAPRILINDTSKTNPYPSASAINVPRDDNDYWEKM